MSEGILATTILVLPVAIRSQRSEPGCVHMHGATRITKGVQYSNSSNFFQWMAG